MATISLEERRDLLRDLSDLGSGQADSERPYDTGHNFYPVPEHTRALEPEVVLVVGDRGAGKSALFNAVTQPDLLLAITRRSPGIRLPSAERGKVTWLPAYPLQREGPDEDGWLSFAKKSRGDPADATRLWFAYLVRTLRSHLPSEAKDSLAELLEAPGGDPSRCFEALQRSGTTPLLTLDKLDEELQRRDAWLFAAYDELDTIVRSDWSAMGLLISALVSFWASYARRWKRLRAKIFLRTDFFRRNTELVGADISKLAANRAELFWSDKNLYAMLLKRIVNRSERLREYCRKARPRLTLEVDPQLQYVPILVRAEEARPPIERIAGEFMGANENKGHSFTWILDHIRDGNAKVSPRALVRLIENAASLEIDNMRAGGAQLLHHVSLRKALDAVSETHVREASTHELPWLRGLRTQMSGSSVPWEHRDLETLLRKTWSKVWNGDPAASLPADNPKDLIDYLIEIGIVRIRRSRRRGAADRLDVPDLFLAGLGLKRKGGVQQE
jgi:hypothetical protein